MYSLIHAHGEIVVDSKKFQVKLLNWLGNNEMLYEQAMSQNITTIYNHYTREETLFNPLRSKRPISAPKINERH